MKKSPKKKPDGLVTICWMDSRHSEVDQLIARMNDHAGMARQVRLQMDMIAYSMPSKPWWKFWADDPIEEYEKWKAENPLDML